MDHGFEAHRTAGASMVVFGDARAAVKQLERAAAAAVRSSDSCSDLLLVRANAFPKHVEQRHHIW
jgi:hypothetical protein